MRVDPKANRDFLPSIVAIVVYLLLDAEQAMAWGPGIHVSIASDVLANSAWLPAAVAGIITRYARDFSYGCIAADMVFAKRLSRVKQFCHHWATGFAVLERARDDRGKAFGYGYLAHLAADTVAHGKFVPHQIVVSGTPVSWGHVYWEMRADSVVDDQLWQRINQILQADHGDHHQTLGHLLTGTLLPYRANQRLFDQINRMVNRPGWRQAMGVLEQNSRHELPAKLVSDFQAEAVDRTMCLLTSLEQSPILDEDPNGHAALTFVRDHRRHVRRLRRRGLHVRHRIREAASAHAPK